MAEHFRSQNGAGSTFQWVDSSLWLATFKCINELEDDMIVRHCKRLWGSRNRRSYRLDIRNPSAQRYEAARSGEDHEVLGHPIPPMPRGN